MRTLLSRSLLLLLFAIPLLAWRAGGAADPRETEKIDRLVKQLGDDEFTKRQTASKELEEIGEIALPALRGATADRDLEVRRRAEKLIKLIMPESRESASAGLAMVRVRAGEFMMGSPPGEVGRHADEKQRKVKISQAFYIGKYEVTQGEFEKVMKFNPSAFSPKGESKVTVAGEDTTRFPVERVTWYDAIEFCNRLSKLDGYPPYYKLAGVKRAGDSIEQATVTVAGGRGYRLPTEAEWEYACRADTTTPYHFGTGTRGDEGNFRYTIPATYGSAGRTVEMVRTTRVGSYPKSLLGLHDMHGNAGEWCWDYYERDYAGTTATDPTGPERGTHRVMRGGSWLVAKTSCRSACRFYHAPSERKNYGGFRVVRSP